MPLSLKAFGKHYYQPFLQKDCADLNHCLVICMVSLYSGPWSKKKITLFFTFWCPLVLSSIVSFALWFWIGVLVYYLWNCRSLLTLYSWCDFCVIHVWEYFLLFICFSICLCSVWLTDVVRFYLNRSISLTPYELKL